MNRKNTIICFVFLCIDLTVLGELISFIYIHYYNALLKESNHVSINIKNNNNTNRHTINCDVIVVSSSSDSC